ncbi:MAG: alpha/beta fold hydrolase, partial [Pseudomonadota bacterium]
GLESSNQGTKSVFFRERYPDMIIPHFKGSLQERMEELDRVLSDQSAIVLVGSSFGGLMGAIFAMEHESRVKKLVLLAPAINLLDATSYHQKRISVPAWIYHGRNDDVIPLKAVQEVAAKVFADLSFQVVDDDHFLHKTFKTLDWDSLLS